jgi:hypothetical protein
MHFVQPSMIHDAGAAADSAGGAKQILIATTKCYYRHRVALPKNEVVVKNCKAALRSGIAA